MPSSIAQVLGVKEATGEPLLNTLSTHLKDKRLLLILDNFEHVMEAARNLSSLLKSAQGLKALVTSRAGLRLSGEREYPVLPLPVPDPKHLPSVEKLAQNQSVALFLERAQAVKPSFDLDGDNAEAIARICARLDGLPLAIELAAARVRALPPHSIPGSPRQPPETPNWRSARPP